MQRNSKISQVSTASCKLVLLWLANFWVDFCLFRGVQLDLNVPYSHFNELILEDRFHWLITELFAKCQFGAIHIAVITDGKVTNLALRFAESEIFHRLCLPIDVTVVADADDGSYQWSPFIDGAVPHVTLKVMCHSHENAFSLKMCSRIAECIILFRRNNANCFSRHILF